VLQIWTHSYCDSNGDGVGDLPGVLSKIEYIKELGIDVIWFSPVFPSPMKDFGYDISDFKNIEPIYGTLDDWDRLKHECDKRGMKIMYVSCPSRVSPVGCTDSGWLLPMQHGPCS
jgi:glycosidase